jgi:hypothetical protein
VKPEKKRPYRPHHQVEWVQKDPFTLTDFEKFNGYTVAEAYAIQALFRGEANKEQQQRAMDWIIRVAAKTHDLHYFDNQRDTDFALGKQFVGQMIIKLSKLDTGEMEKIIKSKQP